MALKAVWNPFTGNIDWVNTGGVGSDPYKVEKVTLSAGDITAKQVTLANTPSTTSLTRVVIITGIEQDYGTDFTVSGAILSWSSLGMESLLETGDKLVIIYN